MATSIKFAGVTVPQSRVFYQRSHVFAMVLHNQICEGHILLAPFQSDKNFRDLSNPQSFELVLAIKELSQLVKSVDADVQGASVVVQEFGFGGTSMNHLRVHIVPRRGRDSRSNAQIEEALQSFSNT